MLLHWQGRLNLGKCQWRFDLSVVRACDSFVIIWLSSVGLFVEHG